MDILCNNINCDGIGMRRADWDNFRECQDIVLNGQVIWEAFEKVLSSAVKSQIYTEYAANPTLAAQIWKAANVYAKSNPTTIPIINAHPKAYHACIDYVTEGLVFQMDCDWLCTAAQWQDRISADVWNGTNVQIANELPKFNGSAYYRHSQLAIPATDTLQVVFKGDAGNNSNCFIFDGGGTSLAVPYRPSDKTLGANTSGTSQYRCEDITQFHTYSVGNSGVYLDKVKLNPYSSESWTPNAGASIGSRGNYQQGFKGTIYAIRRYNRLLTEQEILANQIADLFRWNS